MDKKKVIVGLVSILILFVLGTVFLKDKKVTKQKKENSQKILKWSEKKVSSKDVVVKTSPLKNSSAESYKEKSPEEIIQKKIAEIDSLVPKECKGDSDLISRTTIADLRSMFFQGEINDVFSKGCINSLKGLPWSKIESCEPGTSNQGDSKWTKKGEEQLVRCNQVLLDLKARVLVQSSRGKNLNQLNKQELIAHSILSLNNIAMGKFPETKEDLLYDISLQKELFKSHSDEDRSIKLNYYSYLNLMKDFGYVDFNEDALKEIKELHDDLGLKTEFPPPKGASFDQSFDFIDF